VIDCDPVTLAQYLRATIAWWQSGRCAPSKCSTPRYTIKPLTGFELPFCHHSFIGSFAQLCGINRKGRNRALRGQSGYKSRHREADFPKCCSQKSATIQGLGVRADLELTHHMECRVTGSAIDYFSTLVTAARSDPNIGISRA
jgi:hypothetical protein